MAACPRRRRLAAPHDAARARDRGSRGGDRIVAGKLAGGGQEPRRFDAVVVKSPHCEPQMFAEWASALVNVDAPGATSANLPTLGHTRCARPMWPLERDTPFEPTARVYRRR